MHQKPARNQNLWCKFAIFANIFHGLSHCPEKCLIWSNHVTGTRNISPLEERGELRGEGGVCTISPSLISFCRARKQFSLARCFCLLSWDILDSWQTNEGKFWCTEGLGRGVLMVQVEMVSAGIVGLQALHEWNNGIEFSLRRTRTTFGKSWTAKCNFRKYA